jgi:transcriptional regulator
MYAPSHFDERRPQLLHRLMEQYPLATLVAVTARGTEANHIPLIFEPQDGKLGLLKGHIARANSLWRDVNAGSEVLAVFQGASHYISPNWYPSKREHGKVVPTWNYTVVHARGRICWIHDAAWLRVLVEGLTDRQEQRYASRWQLGDAPPDYIEQMLTAIVGFEIELGSLTGKWKLSQNRNAADRAGVVSSLASFTDAPAREMAALVAHPDKGTGG